MFLSPFFLGGNLGLGEVCITVVVVDVLVVVVIGVVGVVSDMRKRVLNVNVIKFISSYIYPCVHQFTCYPVYIYFYSCILPMFVFYYVEGINDRGSLTHKNPACFHIALSRIKQL